VITDEHERFWSYVVKGPLPGDCWLWTGAISDDAYGRFWVKRDHGQQAVRPQRYAFQLLTGTELPSTVLLLHSCDIPICVHASADAAESHVWPGTHRANMLDRAQKGRHVNGWSSLRFRGAPRAERTQRSRDLRAVILDHGWNPERMSAALAGVEETHPRLF
jgi:hypothetical protein